MPLQYFLAVSAACSTQRALADYKQGARSFAAPMVVPLAGKLKTQLAEGEQAAQVAHS